MAMPQTESIAPVDGLEHHPFASRLEKDEALLWVGRPNRAFYMQRGWRGFRGGVVLGCLVAVASIIGICYPSNPFQTYCCIFHLLMLPLVFGLGIYFTRAGYDYASWYALTNRCILAATSDEGGFVIHKTALGNITNVSVPKINVEVGTVECRCHYAIPTLLSKNLRLEHIDHPEQIRGLILEAKRHTSEG